MESAVHSVPAHRGGGDRARPITARPDVEIVVPVHNEAATFGRAHHHAARLPRRSRSPSAPLVTIADNGSTDGTGAGRPAAGGGAPGRAGHDAGRQGRGHAPRARHGRPARRKSWPTWTSTSRPRLSALLPLVASVLSGHSDVAVGTRLARGPRVVRGPKRELISRAYSLWCALSLRSRVSDFQCGFKATPPRARARAAPPREGRRAGSSTPSSWSRPSGSGCGSTRSPVEWTDDPDSSRARIVSTAVEDLKRLWRSARSRPASSGATCNAGP